MNTRTVLVKIADLERLQTERRELLAVLKQMTPAEGFPVCTEKCLNRVFSYDEEPCCSCGFDEIRHYAGLARELITKCERPT